ncbi:hypothetical protein JW933_08645 [candidate division FCPU426 bacterium]|nr:hypothetical protein [candidate division FCPU426 bacterium]
MLKRILQVLLYTLVWTGVAFWAAGSWDWLRGWIMLVVYLFTFLLNGLMMALYNRDLIKHRGESHADTEKFDKRFGLFFMVAVFSVPVVCGLDAVRWEWSVQPFYTLYLGLGLHMLGTIPLVWSMAMNPFLETTVRIQADKGHYVISAGPYAFVRHPMYLGMLLQYLGIPLSLGSWWAYVPVGICFGLMAWRIVREEETLQDKLPGYKEYMHQTRYRLVPGVW